MTGNVDNMSPDVSPGELKNKSGVRRVNNRPMYIIFAVVGAFVFIMMLVAADRAAQQNAPAESGKEKVGNTSMFANEIAGDQLDGFIPPLEVPVDTVITTPEEPNNEETSNITVIRPENVGNLNNPPMPPQYNNSYSQAEIDDDAQRIRMAKLQMLEEAIKAKTGVQGIAPRSGATPSRTPANRQEMLAEINRVKQQINATNTNDTTAAYKEKLAQVRAMTGANESSGFGGGNGSGSELRNSVSNGGNGYNQFDNNQEGDRWQLNSSVQAPRSQYELRAGYVIPATLISGINSELPGQIVAQVAQDISDTATGNYVLIPQGSRLIGSYSSDVAYGQERVLIAWQRIIYPDGKALDIGSMPGADSAGYSGFKDQVNNHYFRVFSSAFLMSGITAGVTLSQDNGSDGSNKQRASDALSEALGQQLGQVMVEMIRKNMNIAPTLEIRPGYRFNVIVTKDMTFSKPYQSFDY